MKFIKLESRGGNYLVVAENVAWLRTAENGQTSVGIIGGQPLLVVGSVEEVAAKILKGAAEAEQAPTQAELADKPVAVVPAAEVAPVAELLPASAAVGTEADEPEAVLSKPEPHDPKPPQAAGPALPPPAVVQLRTPERPPLARAPDRTRPARSQSMSLADRIARASAPKIKVETQRFMGLAE